MSATINRATVRKVKTHVALNIRQGPELTNG